MRVSWCPGGPGCRELRQTARSCTWSSSDRQWVKREKSQPDESESFMAVFTKELHYVPDTPPDRGSRVTNPCVFYIMPELFLWWLSSCNKTKFHFIYFLWCTQLHSENNYSRYYYKSQKYCTNKTVFAGSTYKRGILWNDLWRFAAHCIDCSIDCIQFDKSFKITVDWSRTVYWWSEPS